MSHGIKGHFPSEIPSIFISLYIRYGICMARYPHQGQDARPPLTSGPMSTGVVDRPAPATNPSPPVARLPRPVRGPELHDHVVRVEAARPVTEMRYLPSEDIPGRVTSYPAFDIVEPAPLATTASRRRYGSHPTLTCGGAPGRRVCLRLALTYPARWPDADPEIQRSDSFPLSSGSLVLHGNRIAPSGSELRIVSTAAPGRGSSGPEKIEASSLPCLCAAMVEEAPGRRAVETVRSEGSSRSSAIRGSGSSTAPPTATRRRRTAGREVWGAELKACG
jgi:hypothetical protein